MPFAPPRARPSALLLLLALLAAPLSASRLSQAQVERLENGLTVMVLEDHTLPLVSTQMLYRIGGRTENPGETGLAHFVEHMAFRASANFPDTDVVSRIYAVGGEWHGYTWIDQTTYFETVPVDQLGLALAIQADRMARLLLPAGELEAERGAVLTELRGYENDPASRLDDAVMAASFVEHPYRNNVIGWEADVRQIAHADVETFYRRHYVPANAVLAVAGDVRTEEVLALVRRAFGAIPGGAPTPLPRSVEPPQRGVRRVDLHGGGSRSRFQIVYRAPAATDPDFPAFLLLQALLAGSSGASFRQDGDPFPARPGSRLHGVGQSVNVFFAATAAPYVLSIAGAADPSAPAARIEEEIERRIADLRERPVPAEELDRVRRDFLTELVLDVETTEDAAHQMAFYEGIGAFEVLRRLPALVDALTPEDLQRAAAARLQPYQRTIGWVHAGPPLILPPTVPSSPGRGEGVGEGGQGGEGLPADRAPRIRRLKNGVTLIARQVPRVPAGYLRVVVPSTVSSEGTITDIATDSPVWRHTSLGLRFRAGELPRALAEARKALATAKAQPAPDPATIEDPEQRLDLALRALLGASPASGGPLSPVVVVAVGDLDEAEVLRLMAEAFAGLPSPLPLRSNPLQLERREEVIPLAGRGLAQSQLGYAVPAPPPSDPASDAWRILLYILSHDYEGRLGKDLIARRGLIYYIGSRYQSDGQAAWIAMTTGVNPESLEPTRKRFAELMNALRDSPPTEAEIEEAKRHLIGRRITAPMSNEEISAAYAREWIEQGRLLSDDDFERRVRSVTREQVLAIVPRFLDGATVVVDVAPHPPAPSPTPSPQPGEGEKSRSVFDSPLSRKDGRGWERGVRGVRAQRR
ncbi:MAG TPA: insulinase family protein [Thermoanaerobaculia bacterium]